MGWLKLDEWRRSAATFPPEEFLRDFGIEGASISFCHASWNLFHDRGGRPLSGVDVREAIRDGTASTGPVVRDRPGPESAGRIS